MKKHSCGGRLVNSVSIIGGYAVESVRCEKCGQTQPDLMQSQLVLAHKRFASGEEELTGTATTVGGGSYAVRFPIQLFRAYNVQPGAQVRVRPTRPGYVEVRLHPAADHIIPAFRPARLPDPNPTEQEKAVVVPIDLGTNTTSRQLELAARHLNLVVR